MALSATRTRRRDTDQHWLRLRYHQQQSCSHTGGVSFPRRLPPCSMNRPFPHASKPSPSRTGRLTLELRVPLSACCGAILTCSLGFVGGPSWLRPQYILDPRKPRYCDEIARFARRRRPPRSGPCPVRDPRVDRQCLRHFERLTAKSCHHRLLDPSAVSRLFSRSRRIRELDAHHPPSAHSFASGRPVGRSDVGHRVHASWGQPDRGQRKGDRYVGRRWPLGPRWRP